MKSKLLLAVVVTSLLATLGCSVEQAAQSSERSAARVDDRPVPTSSLNVMVVVVDDATDIACRDLPRFLPKTSRLMRDQGRCFENATVTSPACCPSRAVLQTGQMGHNNGVTRQIDAAKLRVEDTLQDHLTRAGWDTYGTGKYFNGISPWLFESGERSSGFLTSDFWAGSEYYGYELWDDETGAPAVEQQHINTTTRTGMFLRSFVRDHADGERPFYAYAAFKAPHTDNAATTVVQRNPRPTQRNRTRAVPPFRWRPEADTRDKLRIYRDDLQSRRYYERLYRARTRTMYDVDDEMGKTIDLLREEGILDETAVFFVSDNGYHLGENNWETKGDPYAASMDVPMLAYLPSRFGRGVVDRRPYGLIDVAPTVYQLTGVDPGHVLDGRSMLAGGTRTGTFYELQNENNDVLRREAGYYPGRVPTWAMYRSGDRAYVEYYRRDGSLRQAEYYRHGDYDKNLLWSGYRRLRPSAATLSWFRAKLRAGKTCAGQVGSGRRNPCP